MRLCYGAVYINVKIDYYFEMISFDGIQSIYFILTIVFIMATQSLVNDKGIKQNGFCWIGVSLFE